MKPIITKHYGLGLLVGTGFGLFLAAILIDSDVITKGSHRLMSGVGIVAMMVGGILYSMSLRKPLPNQ